MSHYIYRINILNTHRENVTSNKQRHLPALLLHKHTCVSKLYEVIAKKQWSWLFRQ